MRLLFVEHNLFGTMGELLQHYCGVALVVFRKSVPFLQQKYPLSPPQLVISMLSRQRNRGQDGAGIFFADFSRLPQDWYGTWKTLEKDPVPILLQKMELEERTWMRHAPIWLGHIRYGTYGTQTEEFCQPVHAQIRNTHLFFAGNFNLTSVWQILHRLHSRTSLGSSLSAYPDTLIIAYSLLLRYIEGTPDLRTALKTEASLWDGGWLFTGVTSEGEVFACRDPWGIRPGYFVCTDEFWAVASERPPLLLLPGIRLQDIQELPPGHAIFWQTQNDQWMLEPLFPSFPPRTSCSFERIYFSRPSDPAVYEDRERLGEELATPVLTTLHSLNLSLSEVLFTYVPNTAEVAFLGLTRKLEEKTGQSVLRKKVLYKDTRLRTFITAGRERNPMVRNVYDLTWFDLERMGIRGLVVLDDSIVRGTTLRESILATLDRLRPEWIVFVSSAPQIRFPDFYGIDMSILAELVAFQAVMDLLQAAPEGIQIIQEVERRSREIIQETRMPDQNYVQLLYRPFTEEELSQAIARRVQPPSMHARLVLLYQSLEGLHRAIPHHTGDWYFTGNYPTPGGRYMVHRAFLDARARRWIRPYEASSEILLDPCSEHEASLSASS